MAKHLCLIVGLTALLPASSYADNYKRFPVRDVTLGTPLAKVTGMTCEAKPHQAGRTCVQFLDPKCKGRTTKVALASMNTPIPKGKGCFYNTVGGSTYLDGEKTEPVLESFAITGTPTDSAVIYRIEYTFPDNVLDTDSKLGQALITKYGKPSLVNAPTQFAWSIDSLSVDAGCSGGKSPEYPQYQICKLQVSDARLLEHETGLQDAANAQHDKQAAPPPPPL